MRPPGFLLLCASYGVTAIVHDFSTGKNGLDYCIAEADTTSDIPGVVMLADLLTKAASRAIFTGLIKQLDDFHAL